MRDLTSSSPSVVVGIDGSRSALDAALWAVDEAVSRDIPLRLVYAIDPDNATGTDPQDAARDLATAEIAVRYAFTAVESTDKPVKIEVEILQDAADAGAARGLAIGRHALRRLDGARTQRPRPDRVDRGGFGGVRPLPGGHRPRTRPDCRANNAGWSPRSTSLRQRRRLTARA